MCRGHVFRRTLFWLVSIDAPYASELHLGEVRLRLSPESLGMLKGLAASWKRLPPRVRTTLLVTKRASQRFTTLLLTTSLSITLHEAARFRSRSCVHASDLEAACVRGTAVHTPFLYKLMTKRTEKTMPSANGCVIRKSEQVVRTLAAQCDER